MNLSGVTLGHQIMILLQNYRRKTTYLALFSHSLTWFPFDSTAMWNFNCFYAITLSSLCLKLGVCLVEMGKHSLEHMCFEANVNYGFGNKHLRIWEFRDWGCSSGNSMGTVGRYTEGDFLFLFLLSRCTEALFHPSLCQENEALDSLGDI